MDKHMSGIETSGAIGVAAAKYAVFAKLGATYFWAILGGSGTLTF